jgi:hypothetical protein
LARSTERLVPCNKERRSPGEDVDLVRSQKEVNEVAFMRKEDEVEVRVGSGRWKGRT